MDRLSIPNSVTRDELLESLAPLFSLLGGVAANEIQGSLVIALDEVRFNLVARETGDDDKYPRGLNAVDGLLPPPTEFSELAWPVRVTVK